jgi:hypothetical protein
MNKLLHTPVSRLPMSEFYSVPCVMLWAWIANMPNYILLKYTTGLNLQLGLLSLNIKWLNQTTLTSATQGLETEPSYKNTLHNLNSNMILNEFNVKYTYIIQNRILWYISQAKGSFTRIFYSTTYADIRAYLVSFFLCIRFSGQTLALYVIKFELGFMIHNSKSKRQIANQVGLS